MKKITIDTCILFDFFNGFRTFHKDAVILFNKNNIELFIVETTLKEVIDIKQRDLAQELIKNKKLNLLPEPEMGSSIPMSIPLNMTHISSIRDHYMKVLTKKRGGRIQRVGRDFLIAEAHFQSKNDYLLTRDLDDYRVNEDIIICNYKELFNKL